jgi:phosphatidylserine/phosphatidylglycerophosphate/cardiolipin synthase-like enzyme
MRKRKTKEGLTVNCIAGTHTVHMGLNLSDARRKKCLGFAIQREDHTEDERYWMSGSKTFKSTDPGLGPGGQISSREHPYQTFQWSDYSAKPDHDYTYTVIPLYGSGNNLTTKGELSVRVKTEKEFNGMHSVFFNRGAVASQEYARRFMNKAPDTLAGNEQVAAYRWLSRGLLEAFQSFVSRASGANFGLYGAIYEFQWSEALAAIKAASAGGAKVEIVYDGIGASSGPRAKNELAIAGAQLTQICKPRTTGKIMHNKFLVLTRGQKAIAVWTGSTNLTENGIFGHLNCGHVVEDPAIAAQYLAYFHQLKTNPVAAAERTWMGTNNSAPPNPWNSDTTAIFSPRTGINVLQWYADVADAKIGNLAKKPLFMSFAFGMHKNFQKVYEQNDGILRIALMEKEGNGAALAQGKIDIRRIRRLPNIVVAIGNNIAINSFDRWLQEKRALTAEANVRYIHTKFMLFDPLGPKPIVVTGSANFSEASCNANNENMLVIRNDKRIADIYFGEFMRLYSHYAFREAVAIARANGDTQWKPNYLSEDDSWQKDYYTNGNQRYLRRVYFAG